MGQHGLLQAGAGGRGRQPVHRGIGAENKAGGRALARQGKAGKTACQMQNAAGGGQKLRQLGVQHPAMTHRQRRGPARGREKALCRPQAVVHRGGGEVGTRRNVKVQHPQPWGQHRGKACHGQLGELGRDGAGKGIDQVAGRKLPLLPVCGGENRMLRRANVPLGIHGKAAARQQKQPAAGGRPAVNGKAAFNGLVLQAADLEQIARIGQNRPVQLGQAGAASFTLEPGLPAQHVAEGGPKLGLACAHAPLILQRAGQAGGQSPQGEKVGRRLPFGRRGQGELL